MLTMHEGLAHAIMEAEKSWHILCARQWSRKAGVGVPVQIQCWEPRVWVLVQVQRPEKQECWILQVEDRCPSSSREPICPSSTFFILFRPLRDRIKPSCIGEGGSSLLYLLIQMLIPSRHAQKCLTSYLGIPNLVVDP